MQMNRALTFLFIAGLLACGSASASAQVIAAATGRQFSVTVGGIGSAFQPDYDGGGVPSTSPNRLYGLGGYVDVKFTRWFQAEAEGRWLKFNQLNNISQSNYLVGPRVPIHKFWRATPYAKVLFGFSNMNFEFGEATGRFTDIAYGGGVDIKVTKRISVRAFDFEYQEWPTWYAHQALYPYGASVGASYRVF
jgi:hypothetical protein